MRNAAFASLLLLATLSAAAREADDLLLTKCVDGALVVTAKNPWHVNTNAPWHWDKGTLVSKDATQVKFKGPKCEGTVKAFIVNGDQSKGPINTPVK